MPLVQDRSLDLLTSSPARYHCTTDAPTPPSSKATHSNYVIGPFNGDFIIGKLRIKWLIKNCNATLSQLLIQTNFFQKKGLGAACVKRDTILSQLLVYIAKHTKEYQYHQRVLGRTPGASSIVKIGKVQRHLE